MSQVPVTTLDVGLPSRDTSAISRIYHAVTPAPTAQRVRFHNTGWEYFPSLLPIASLLTQSAYGGHVANGAAIPYYAFRPSFLLKFIMSVPTQALQRTAVFSLLINDNSVFSTPLTILANGTISNLINPFISIAAGSLSYMRVVWSTTSIAGIYTFNSEIQTDNANLVYEPPADYYTQLVDVDMLNDLFDLKETDPAIPDICAKFSNEDYKEYYRMLHELDKRKWKEDPIMRDLKKEMDASTSAPAEPPGPEPTSDPAGTAGTPGPDVKSWKKTWPENMKKDTSKLPTDTSNLTRKQKKALKRIAKKEKK